MNIADVVVIIVLCLCVVLAVSSLFKKNCHDCMHCHKECGGRRNG